MRSLIVSLVLGLLLGACAKDQTSESVPDVYDLRVNGTTTKAQLKQTAAYLDRAYDLQVDYSATQFDNNGLIQYLDMSVNSDHGAGGRASGDRAGLETHDFGFRVERGPDGDITLTNLFFLDEH